MWLDSILEIYINEFVVDTAKFYNESEREFFNGPRGRFLLSLQLSIKMLVCEKGILKITSSSRNLVCRGSGYRDKRGETNGKIRGRWVQVSMKL